MKGERSISARTAIRLGQASDTAPQNWLNLQMIYNLKRARAEMLDATLHRRFTCGGWITRIMVN
jgi:plasmid maintenance system antidote protein VapI